MQRRRGASKTIGTSGTSVACPPASRTTLRDVIVVHERGGRTAAHPALQPLEPAPARMHEGRGVGVEHHPLAAPPRVPERRHRREQRRRHDEDDVGLLVTEDRGRRAPLPPVLQPDRRRAAAELPARTPCASGHRARAPCDRCGCTTRPRRCRSRAGRRGGRSTPPPRGSGLRRGDAHRRRTAHRGPGTHGRRQGVDADEIDHQLIVAQQRREPRGIADTLGDDHDVRLAHRRLPVVRHQLRDVRQPLVDVGAVAPDQAAERDVRIADPQRQPFADQRLGQRHERAFAQVVAAALEAQAEQRDAALAALEHDVHDAGDVRVVAGDDTPEERRREVSILGDVVERAQILRQARAAEAEAGREIPLRDVEVAVLAEDAHHLAPVDAELLAQRADLVRERHLERVVGVARVLHHRRFVGTQAVDRRVQVRVGAEQRVAGARIGRADDGERRREEVANGAALAQEFGVDAHADVHARRAGRSRARGAESGATRARPGSSVLRTATTW